MTSFLFALLLAGAPAPDPSPAELDRRCFGVMARLAEQPDARIRSVGRVAAQYFLGRIDAEDAAFDPDAAIESAPEAAADLLRRCGDVMGEAGRDFRSLRLPAVPGAAI